jgi:hypothetical protein
MYFKTLKETSVVMEEALVISWYFLGSLPFEIFAKSSFGAGTTKKLFSRMIDYLPMVWELLSFE